MHQDSLQTWDILRSAVCNNVGDRRYDTIDRDFLQIEDDESEGFCEHADSRGC